ncbi:unnamed protein product [Meganyctiphanes norvegica]|uniref:Dual specificity protein phosphatase 23 n=1 Tax=Meganyctiphanes norvegica TaxID=48144 RepID=A0AAV2RR38_MEGNR
MGFFMSLYSLTSKMSHNGPYRSPSRSRPEGNYDNGAREVPYDNYVPGKDEVPYRNYPRGSYDNHGRSKSDGGYESQGRSYTEGSYGPYDPGIAEGQPKTLDDQRHRREKRDEVHRSPRRSSEPKCHQGTFASGRQRGDIGSAPDLAASGSPPYNFSWVEPGRICASAWPQTLANVIFLKSEGVGHCVTLSRDKRPPAGTTERGIQCHLIDVPEFLAPTMTQIDNFIGICDWSRSAGLAVCVHCRMGRGRTGTMLACYLVKYFNKTPQEAIAQIRQLRPYSIETREQEYAVEDYYEYIRRDPQTYRKRRGAMKEPEKYIFPSDI